MSRLEIEIKSLLGSKENADALIARLKVLDPGSLCISRNKQLNHYFIDGDTTMLYKNMVNHLPEDTHGFLKKILTEGKKHSIRSREVDGKVLLVVKASLDDSTSSNGISRMEFEEPVQLTLAELDQKLLDAGFSYQAKWSREREEYKSKGMNVCIDKNAGYGYLAEFEKVVEEGSDVEDIKKSLRNMMESLEVEELAQDRLERMFAHYNEHWPEYYGTENIFVIE
jgi:adenylate cyclase class IV